MAVRFSIVSPATAEGRDIRKVLQSLIDEGKEELTAIGLGHDDTNIIRGKIVAARMLLQALEKGPAQ